MKIQIASDLHLEFLSRLYPNELLIDHVHDVDVLVLAGDIHSGAKAIDAFKDYPVPHIVYVMGNHEGYGYDWEFLRRHIREQAKGTRIHFLDNDAVEIDGVRFLGATLWTDFKIEGKASDNMKNANYQMADFSRIRLAGGEKPFTPKYSLSEHERSRHWIDEQLSVPFDGKTVLVTHHGVHPNSIHAKYADSDINPAFNSDLSEVLKKVDLAIHGHVHDCFDYEVHGCRVVANPSGYIYNAKSAWSKAHFHRENMAFNPALIVEV